MNTYLYRLKSRAFALGLTAYDLARRRFMRSGCVGCVDEAGTISFRPRVLCRPELAGHRTIFKTETT